MEINPQDLLSYINALGQQIGINNQLLLDNVNRIIQKAEHQNRKKRRKKEGEQLVVCGDLYLSVNRFYDDGKNEIRQISNKLTGKNTTYTLDFQGMEETEKFGIFFKNDGIWVIGSKDKVKASYLFQCFVKAAGPFCPGIAHKVIGELLYDHWAVIIEQTENRITVPVLAGWDGSKFLHKENYMFKKTTNFPLVPVLEKEFPRVNLTEEISEIYFGEFQKIAPWKERLLISLYPFAGILCSVFNEMHTYLNISLNFVEIEPMDRKIVCSWLKIFNRKTLLPTNLNLTEMELRRLLSTCKDEVVILDATAEDFLTSYHRGKIKKNIKTAIMGMKQQGNITERQRINPSYACVFFSRERILEKGVQNIFVDSEFYKDDGRNTLFIEHHVMEAVLSDFVSYAQKNLESIWNIIMKKMREDGRDAQVIGGVYDIVTQYWKGKGVCFTEALKVPPKINWTEIIGMHEYDEEELIETFIEVIRKGIQHFYGVEKKRGNECRKGAFFYSFDYIWFPTKILRLILSKQGMMPYMDTILLILRDRGVLIVDKIGFSRKLQMSGKSIETYQMKRDFFNQLGVNDIVDMAKGEDA